MIWKNVKSLLIVLLVAVNLFIGFLALNYYKSSRFTDSDTANAASKVLENGGISVLPDVIAVENDIADILTCSYDRENYLATVSMLFLGREADGVYLLPSGIRAETREGDCVLLGYDMSISYSSVNLADNISTALKYASPVESEESKAGREALAKLIAMPKGSLKNAPCVEYGEYMFITVDQFENGLAIYDMNCVFGLRGGRIVYAEGKHFFGVPDKEESAQLLDRVNILFSEKERGEVGDITDVTLCYTLYEDFGNHRMMLVPSYDVRYSDGRSHAVNAINREKYQLP